ncbi:MAG: DUF438 domain-containing protein [Firmicutes bacterium]|nr:DUF438 domain-containing protein [Bacillota bacterium]
MSELINNREERQRIVKELIKELHDGKTVEDVKQRFKELLDGIGASELSVVEQKLIEEGMPAEEVKRLCDVHVQVFRESLDEQQKPESTPGHPVHTFIRENRAVENVIANIEAELKKLKAAKDGDDVSSIIKEWRRLHDDLMDIIRHFSRKENILFPYLEKQGISGPSTVMWAIHDDIRGQLKKTRRLLADTGPEMSADLRNSISELVEPMHHTIKELFYKEENIMFPTSLEVLSEQDWVEIYEQSDEIGYTLIEPEKKWTPKGDGDKPTDDAVEVEGGLRLDTGVLTQEQIDRMLNTLPLDITFVDANDEVKYFSRGKERIFERAPAIIGRKVQFCHPQASVHVVERIVNDFKSGKRDHADFWINMGGNFIFIRYFAVHDKDGKYMGTLEVTQNVSEIRSLEGEKRIDDHK